MAVCIALLLTAPVQTSSAVPGAASEATNNAPSVRNFSQLAQAAETARNEGRNDDAIRFYQLGLKLKPQWEQGLWYLSTLFYDKERYSKARDLLRRFVTVRPDAGPGWALLGMSEFQTREYDRSLDHLQRGTTLGLDGRKEMAQSVFYFVAVLLTRSEQYDESMDLLFQMVAAGHTESELVEPAGLAALRMPLLPAEVPSDRSDLVRTAGRAAFALQAQHQDDAENMLKGMVATYPNEPGVHFLYGAYLMNVRPEEGVREMRRELEVSPSHVPARLRISEYYIKEQQLDQARSLAEEAVKLEPDRASGHMVLGEVFLAQGNSGDGIRELETAKNAAPHMVNIRWDLLRAYTAAGRTEDAKREKEEIEKLSRPTTQQ